MTTPSSPPVLEGKLSLPSAQATPQQSAAYRLGQVLKELVHKSMGVFHSEGDLLDALNVIEDFVTAFTPASAIRTLATGAERALIEDVSKRIPPGGAAPVTNASGSLIDYDKLAAAIVRAQQNVTPPAITATVTDLPNSQE